MPKNTKKEKKARKEKKASQRALVKKDEKKKKKKKSTFTIDNRVPKGTRVAAPPPHGEYVAYDARTGERVVMSGATATYNSPLYQPRGSVPLNPVDFLRHAAHTLPQRIARRTQAASSSEE
jgi:hypothetical protein